MLLNSLAKTGQDQGAYNTIRLHQEQSILWTIIMALAEKYKSPQVYICRYR